MRTRGIKNNLRFFFLNVICTRIYTGANASVILHYFIFYFYIRFYTVGTYIYVYNMHVYITYRWSAIKVLVKY